MYVECRFKIWLLKPQNFHFMKNSVSLFWGWSSKQAPTDLETAEDDFEKNLEKNEDLIKIFNCSKVCICKKRNGKMGIK